MFRLVFHALAGLLLTGAAGAATIEQSGTMQTDPGVGCSLTLSGQILPGDTDRLKAILDAAIAQIDNYPSGKTEEQIVLCLESPGGSFPEAIRMAELLYDLAVTTRIPPNGECLSACALAFMGGNLQTRSGVGSLSSRYLHPTSRLGFHAPALVLPEGQFTREDVQRAYGVAIEAVGLISEKSHKLRIPQPLLTQMFTHTGADFHFVDRVDHLAIYDLDLYGYSSKALIAPARDAACWNAFRWQFRSNAPLGSLTDFNDFIAHFRTVGDGLAEYYPFDGTMYCRVSVLRLGGGDVDSVMQSEFQDLRSPRIHLSFPQWVRFPGPALLVNLPDGTLRDF